MRLLAGLCCLFLYSRAVSCLTNAEFYDLVKEYISENEEISHLFDIDDDEVAGDVPDQVIELSGSPDEEIDLVDLLNQIGFLITEESTSSSGLKGSHLQQPVLGGCGCRRLSCSCCVSKRFKFKIGWKKVKFNLNACVSVSYLTRNKGFLIEFKLNGRRLFKREISLARPPSLCYGVPGLKRIASVCLEFYNINLRTKRICARIAGVLNLRIKKFRVRLNIGCFRIPIADTDAILNLPGDSDFLSADQSANYTDILQGYEQTSVDTDEANEEFDVSEDLDESAYPKNDDELMARLVDAFMRLQEESFMQNADFDVSEMFEQDDGDGELNQDNGNDMDVATDAAA